MRRFEFRDGSSAKFWAIEVDGTTITTRWGRIGTDGQTKSKAFADTAAAEKAAAKQIAGKVKKGYAEIAQAKPTAPSAAAEPTKPSPPEEPKKPSDTTKQMLRICDLHISQSPGRDRCQAIRDLVEAGADIQGRGYQDHTPLLSIMKLSSEPADLASARFLLERGADVRAVNESGDGVLQLLVTTARSTFDESQAELFETLVAAGAERGPSHRHRGRPLILCAAFQAGPRMLQALIAAGIDPMATDERGYTALHWAAMSDHVVSAQFFLDLGVDPNARDNEDKTALDTARAKKSKKVHDLLKPLTAKKAKVKKAPEPSAAPSESAPAVAGATRRFEFTDGGASKFWEIGASGSAVTTHWGRIDTAGQSKTKDLGSAEAAEKHTAKQIAGKVKKGYAECRPAEGEAAESESTPVDPARLAAALKENTITPDSAVGGLLNPVPETWKEVFHFVEGNLDPWGVESLVQVCIDSIDAGTPRRLDGDQVIKAPFFHHGDLVVKGHLDIHSTFVVIGSVTVEGCVADAGPGDSHVIVTGDLGARAVWTCGDFHVHGTLTAEVVYGHYNDGTLGGGTIRARLVIEDDHLVEASVEADHHFESDEYGADVADEIAALLVPEVCDPDEGVDSGALFAHLRAGKPVFLYG